ncbi:Os02g0484100 [Oryza sativa Japonica Group]|uniref:Os02g0484100 protein n=1 Tax=Oryza sativa subsp. japonica TaxID=39947 RepID=A0A0P0VJ71_ORYSJ|nr:Os02g0484100 [Oryza sativa Japonica Group]
MRATATGSGRLGGSCARRRATGRDGGSRPDKYLRNCIGTCFASAPRTDIAAAGADGLLSPPPSTKERDVIKATGTGAGSAAQR